MTMKKEIDITNDDIRIIGANKNLPLTKSPSSKKWIIAAIIISIIALAAIATLLYPRSTPIELPKEIAKEIPKIVVSEKTTPAPKGYVEILEETVNDVPLYIYRPLNATMSLSVGEPNKSDSSIVFIAQAAGIRKDNGGIVGALVLDGKPLATSPTKDGYCAIINGKISIGTAKDSPLYDKAIAQKGDFFRQYALVDNGEPVINKPKGKAIRRAIGERRNEIVMIESRSRESFYDFAQALADIGMKNAIYLEGSTAYGWCVDEQGKQIEFGVETNEPHRENTSYIVWRTNN